MRKEEEHREEKINKLSPRKAQLRDLRQRPLEETVPEDEDAGGYTPVESYTEEGK